MSDRDTEVRGAALFTLLSEAERMIESEGGAVAGAMVWDAKRTASSYLGTKVHDNAFQLLRAEFVRTGNLKVN